MHGQLSTPLKQAVELDLGNLIAQAAFDAAATLAIRSYGPEILGYLVNVMNDAGAANEVYSQFIEDLWRGITKFRPLAMFRTWAYCLARNALSRYYREPFRRRTRRLLTEEQDRLMRETSGEISAEKVDPEETLAYVRHQLTPDERELITLHLDRGMNWLEIGEVVGLSHAAARKRFQRLKEKIRGLLAARSPVVEVW